MRNRNHAIDILRALSVLYIVGYWHLFNYIQGFPHANYYTEALTYTILGTFTFASGYLLAGRALGGGVAGLLAFYRRRLLRIYPLYAIALVIFVGIGLVDATIATRAALLVSMLLPPAPPTLWFITMIMSFYLIAPLLINFAERTGVFLAIVVLIMVGLQVFAVTVNPIDERVMYYFPAFAMGVVTGRDANMRQLVHDYRLVWLLLLIPAFLIFQLRFDKYLALWIMTLPMVLIGTLVAFTNAERYLGARDNSIVAFISYCSFCMYLFHRVVYHYTKLVYFPADLNLQIAYMLIVGMTLTILLSYVVQRSYDIGIAELERRL